MLQKILVIDDEMTIDLVKYIFDNDQYIQVDGILENQDYLKIIKENHYDTILLNASPSNLHGMEILKEIRKMGEYYSTPILIMTNDKDIKYQALVQGATDFLPKPFDIKELSLRVSNYLDFGRILKLSEQSHIFMQKSLENKIEKIEQALKVAQESQYEIAYRLAKASELRDTETGMHIKRMSLYSYELSKFLNFSKKEQELIYLASPLHDVGKIGIRDAILLKPGRFTDEEFNKMKEHTIIGGEILDGNDNLPLLKYGKIIALQHHEKIDGTGYPYGLKGDEIHPFAKIVAIADVFDALTSPRVYKKAFSIEKAINIMLDGKGTHFEAEYLETFISNLDHFLKIKEEYSD
jgi:putative two-component system response regulator